MTHGPSMKVYDLEEDFFRKKKERLKKLFLQYNKICSREEREFVAKHVNDTLFSDGEDGFCYWNHKEGQEIEKLSDLLDMWYEYGELLSFVCRCKVLLSCDSNGRPSIFCDNGEYWIMEDDESNSIEKVVEILELRLKVEEGNKAMKKLEDMDGLFFASNVEEEKSENREVQAVREEINRQKMLGNDERARELEEGLEDLKEKLDNGAS